MILKVIFNIYKVISLQKEIVKFKVSIERTIITPLIKMYGSKNH